MSNYPENPYPGLQPYTIEEQAKFFGRQTDRDIVIDKTLTHPLTLLFAASGVGKSSLLQAAVIPYLSSDEGENLDVIYYMDWVSPPLTTLPEHIIATLKNQQRLPTDFSLDKQPSMETLLDVLRFCALFVRSPLVLVLDQFEEFFRYQRNDKQAFDGFIEQLTDVINDKKLPVNVVISMREDFALELNAFKPRLPTVLFENFYRLEKLTREGAEAAIRIPVEQVAYHYEPALLMQLVDDLLSEELKRETELLVTDQAVSSVEPPYLQIVCRQLWDLNVADPEKTLRLSSYEQAGKAEGLVRDFLQRTLEDFSREEKNIASAAFDYLVAQRGVKVAYLVDVLATIIKVKPKKLARVLAKLADDKVRLLRAQQRGDSVWYELYHDMFSPSIERWNQAWKKQRQKKQRWVMGSFIAVLLLTLGFLVESFLWVLNNNFPAEYLFKQQEFRLMHWGLKPEPLPEIVKIEVDGKSFTMGELDEDFIASIKRQPEYKKNFGVPNRTVTLNNDFYAGRYEVTYEQYDYYVWQQHKVGKKKVIYPTSSVHDTKRGQKAVTYVSQEQAMAYTQWLSEKTGDAYRLPTEMEWEYAARAGTTMAYWWGDEAGKNWANCNGCESKWDKDNKLLVAPVGQFKPNPFGLYDTAGNVWEWTCTEWQDELVNIKETCATKESSNRRAIRGGSWSSKADWLRSSARFRLLTYIRYDNVGFRVFRFSPQDK